MLPWFNQRPIKIWVIQWEPNPTFSYCKLETLSTVSSTSSVVMSCIPRLEKSISEKLGNGPWISLHMQQSGCTAVWVQSHYRIEYTVWHRRGERYLSVNRVGALWYRRVLATIKWLVSISWLTKWIYITTGNIFSESGYFSLPLTSGVAHVIIIVARIKYVCRSIVY